MGMYDEFGNYVGPELDDDSDGGSGEDRDEVCVVRRTLNTAGALRTGAVSRIGRDRGTDQQFV